MEVIRIIIVIVRIKDLMLDESSLRGTWCRVGTVFVLSLSISLLCFLLSYLFM